MISLPPSSPQGFHCFFFLQRQAKIFNAVPSSREECGQHCPVPKLTEETLSLPPLSLMSAAGSSYVVFYQVEDISFYFQFAENFSVNCE